MALMRTRPRWVRWVAWTLGLLAAVIALLHLWFAANIWWWRDHPVGETSFMSYRLDQLREKNPKAQLRYAWVPYGRISNNLKRAMVAAEDAKFVEHEGLRRVPIWSWPAPTKAPVPGACWRRSTVPSPPRAPASWQAASPVP
jgi:membrane peptidoglycan carboxypeptidase